MQKFYRKKKNVILIEKMAIFEYTISSDNQKCETQADETLRAPNEKYFISRSFRPLKFSDEKLF